jgi:regulation of enolase protein 1 (concanavalin A-like superfamily)
LLTVAAGPRTDLFNSPEDGSVRAEAPLLLGSYRGEFQFSALVAPAFGAAFDAGALIVREGRIAGSSWHSRRRRKGSRWWSRW